MGKVRASIPDVRLLVVGRDGRPDRYKRLARHVGIASRVVWTGGRSDVDRLYNAADVVALPTRYEPFGNVVLEAMATAVPVIISAGAGSSEIVSGDLDSLVVQDPTDADELAHRVVRGLQGGEALGQQALATAHRYSVDAMLDGYEGLYQRMAGR
jgi:glycosyltransferase involved in cell wall biosynthesis